LRNAIWSSVFLRRHLERLHKLAFSRILRADASDRV
jgi:hypothetical protein